MQLHFCDNPTDEDFISVGRAMWDAVQAFRDAEVTADMPRDRAIDSFIDAHSRQKREIERLTRENVSLKMREIERLRNENLSISREIERLRNEKTLVTKENLSISREIESLRNEKTPVRDHEVAGIDDCDGDGEKSIHH